MKLIKNIIFDLGGVILNLDYGRTYAAFKQLGALQFELSYTLSQQKTLFDLFEIGKISADDFRKLIKSHYGLTISDKEFDKAWNAMLLDLPKEKIEFIKNLKEQNGYKTFLFSNTNEIHLQSLRDAHGPDMFSGCFIKEYYSHEVGIRKPSPDAFLTVLYEHNLLADQTLFLDDSIEHVEAAKETGLHSELITDQVTLFKVLEIIKKLQK